MWRNLPWLTDCSLNPAVAHRVEMFGETSSLMMGLFPFSSDGGWLSPSDVFKAMLRRIPVLWWHGYYLVSFSFQKIVINQLINLKAEIESWKCQLCCWKVKLGFFVKLFFVKLFLEVALCSRHCGRHKTRWSPIPMLRGFNIWYRR